MTGSLPLPALLSHLLVAFTIEFDNEFEHRFPHRTTNHGSTPGSPHAPWLVSLVMWLNCMQFLDEKGMTVRQLEQAARTKTNLNGMERWGYVSIDTGRVIRPTAAGLAAQQIWRPLLPEIEDRWRHRYSDSEIEHLRNSLIDRIDPDLPDCLPILGYGLFSNERSKGPRENSTGISLPSLLSKVLLSFAIEFEAESEVSLAISANVLRLAEPDGVRVRDLPRLAGVSKEGIAMALTFLEKRKLAVVQMKLLRLTPAGDRACDTYFRLLRAIEERWQARTLRTSLEPIVARLSMPDPYPDNWRASLPKPEALPHYPMLLHRGGFPDGS